MGLNHNSLYGVFGEVIRLHFHCVHNSLSQVRLYPGQPHMLFALAQRDGKSQRELAEILNIKPATITVMINRMEKAGLVERREDMEDQRVSRVYITEQGRKVCEEVKTIMNDMSKSCFKNFTQEEEAILKKLLLQVRDNLKNVCENTK